MRRKLMYGYRFTEQNGICEITARAEINPYHIERILGKAKVKGTTTEYEYIYIKSYHSNFEGLLLTERKNLKFDIVEHFIERYSNGDRTVEHNPYYEDLKDDELLDDLEIEVLTYKHFYPMGSGLCTCFYSCKKKDISEELKEKLSERTRRAVEEKIQWDALRKADIERSCIVFEPYKAESEE